MRPRHLCFLIRFLCILCHNRNRCTLLMRGPCWTCRKRTIQCDQSGSPCAKCEKAGLECLDKRPLRWVKGVAIRGKMRGQDFDTNKSHLARPRRKQLSHNSEKGRSVQAGLSPVLQDPHISSVDRFYIDYCKSVPSRWGAWL